MVVPSQPSLPLQNIYLVIVCIVPLILLVVTAGAFRRRNFPLAKTLLLFNVLSLETSVMYMLLAITLSPDLAFVTARLRFLGMAFMPFSYIFLAAEFTGNSAWINRKTVTALLIPPIITQLAIWDIFGQRHFYNTWIFVRYDIMSSDIVSFRDLYWLFIVYSYAAVIAPAVGLLRFARHEPPFRRRQALVIAFGGVAALLLMSIKSLVGNLALNPTPLGLLVWALACSWVLFRQRLLDVIPVAYRHIFQGMRDGVIVLNNDRVVVQVNRAAEVILQQPPQEITGRQLIELPLLQNWAKQSVNISEDKFEIAVPQVGSQHIYEGNYSTLVSEGAGKVGQLLILRDITDRKQTEENLRHRNEHLTALQQISFELLKRQPIDSLLQAIVDQAAVILHAPYGELMLHEHDELVIRAFSQNQLYLKNDRATRTEAKLSWQAFDSRLPVYLDDYQTWPEHRSIYDSENLHAVADFPIVKGDECLGVLAMGRSEPNQPFQAEDIQNGILFSQMAALALDNARLYDSALREISERHKVENALRESDDRLKYILSNAPVILMTINLKSGQMFISDSAVILTGYPPEIYSDWNVWMGKIHPDDVASLPKGTFGKVGETVRASEYRFLHADGTYRWVRGEGRFVLDAQGAPLEYVAYAVDVTERKQTEEALRESEERYRQLLEHVPVALTVLDIETFDVLYINPVFRDAVPGFESAEPEDTSQKANGFRTWVSRLTPDSRQTLQLQMQRLTEPTRGEYIKGTEYKSINPDGTTLYLKLKSVLTNYDHRPALLATLDNVTETRLAIQAEAEQRRFTEALLDTATALNSTLRFQEVLNNIFSNLEKIVSHARINVMMIEDEYARPVGWRGYEEDEVTVIKDISFFIQTTPNMKQMVESREPLLIGDTLNDPSWRSNIGLGGIRSYLGVPIVSRTDVIGFINLDSTQPLVFNSKDIERLRAFAAQIAIAMVNARQYEHVQEEAAAVERQRLARELHDAVSQTLFSASVTAEAVERLMDRGPEFVRQGLGQVVKLTRGALSEMRALLVELRPSALQETELSQLLPHLVNSFKTRTLAETSYSVEGVPLEIPAEQKISLYRIAQEALNNIVKHSHAQQVTVELKYSECRACLRITDDGIGFNPEDTLSQHFGVHIMRERAALASIDFAIHSVVAQGTVIEAIWECR